MSKRLYVGNVSTAISEDDVKQTFGKYGSVERIDMKQGYCFVEYSTSEDALEAVKKIDGSDVKGQKLTVQHSKGKPRTADEFRAERRSRRDSSPRGGDRGDRGGDRGDRGDRGGDRGDRGDFRRERRDFPSRRSGPSNHSENRIVVENLNHNATWQSLKDHFRKTIGDVVYTNVFNDDSGKPYKGIVEFKYHDDVERAIRKLDNSDFYGSVIHIREDKPRYRRSRSKSPGRGNRRFSPYKRRTSRSPRRKSPSRSRSRSPAPRKSPIADNNKSSPKKAYSRSPSPQKSP